MAEKKCWLGSVPPEDDFGLPIEDEFIDAVTKLRGMWATMTPASWEIYRASPDLGTGKGQRYKRQADGRWLKVEG